MERKAGSGIGNTELGELEEGSINNLVLAVDGLEVTSAMIRILRPIEVGVFDSTGVVSKVLHMRLLALQIGVVLLVGPAAFGLQITDLVGTWDVIDEVQAEEGLITEARERVTYGADGKYLSYGGAFLLLEEERVRVLTIGAEERGTFEIKEDKIQLQTTKIGLDFFASQIPEMSREVFEDSFEELFEQKDVYTVVSITKDKIVIKDEEDGARSVMTRQVPKSSSASSKSDVERGKIVAEDPYGERYRRFSMDLLDVDGFSASKWLPTWKMRNGMGTEIRKKEEILDRLMCSYAAVTWVVIPEATLPSEHLQALLEKRGLKKFLTAQEKEILGTARKDAGEKFGSSVGWQMENMWALAWVLGFKETPDIDQDQIGEETIRSIWQFLDPAWTDKSAFIEKLKMKPLNEVVQLEDIFYCAHNAVRSAQTGKEECVPKGFHPVRHGGIIHEKRHSLTWVLSPGVDWAKTDLST